MGWVRAVVGGVLVDAQRWSVGVSIFSSLSSNPSSEDMGTLAQSIYAAWLSSVWNASSNALKPYFPAAGNSDKCSTYWYTIQGPATVQGVSSGAAVYGTDGAVKLPPQTAAVASLVTGLPGRKNRGRIYLPLPGFTALGTNRQASTADCSGLATNVAAWLTAINALSLGAADLTVSVLGKDGVGAPVTQVRVDTVLDTQRRRRDKLLAQGVGTHAVAI